MISVAVPATRPVVKPIYQILPAIQEASDVALSYFRRADLRGRRKQDGSLVTEADTAVDALLVPVLERAYPGATIISEERQSVAKKMDGLTILLDPIDGTSAFASGVPGFCISVGFLLQGRPVAGVVAAPAWGTTWHCDFDTTSPAMRNDCPVDLVDNYRPFDSRSTALVDSKLHRRWSLTGFPGRCRSFGSTALHLCLVAGSANFSVAHTGRVHPWDLAGAHAILHRVGMSMVTVDGEPIAYEAFMPDGVVPADVLAGHLEQVTAFRSYLAPR